MGKISKGGFPKADGVLYKLTDPANGTGIDAIWCANPENNANKQFAIVEAKASRDEDGPKFARTHPAKRNPSVVSKLGCRAWETQARFLSRLKVTNLRSREPAQKPPSGKGKDLETIMRQLKRQPIRVKNSWRYFVQMSRSG